MITEKYNHSYFINIIDNQDFERSSIIRSNSDFKNEKSKEIKKTGQQLVNKKLEEKVIANVKLRAIHES